MKDIYQIPDGSHRCKYLLTFDPLDGPSNMDVNVSVATIFSNLRFNDDIENPTVEDFLQAGQVQSRFAPVMPFMAPPVCEYLPPVTVLTALPWI